MEDGFGVAGLNCLKLTDKSRQVRLLQREILQQMSIGTVCIRAVREISKRGWHFVPVNGSGTTG